MEDQNQQKKCQLCRKVVDILCDYTSVEGEKTENICQDCCGKIAEKEEEERKWDEEQKKYGSDYHQLATSQQEGREKADSNWKDKRDKGYRRRKICRYCVREFPWDKDLDFLPAKQKVERELENHEHICPKKNDKSGRQKLKQEKWEKDRKTKTSFFYSCAKCWGKIRWDKKIKSVKAAKKQAVADSTYHKKIECGKNLTSYNIAVYFSPPQGGNKHADLIYADGIDKSLLTIEQDNQGEIYQEPVNWIGWIIGGVGILAVGIGAYFLIRKKRQSSSQEKSQEKH